MKRWRFRALNTICQNTSQLCTVTASQLSSYMTSNLFAVTTIGKLHWRGCSREPCRTRGRTKSPGSRPPLPLKLLHFYIFYILRFYGFFFFFFWKKILASKSFKNFFLIGCIQTNRKSMLRLGFLGPYRSAFAHLCFRLCLRLSSKTTVRKNLRESMILFLRNYFMSSICKTFILQTVSGKVSGYFLSWTMRTILCIM